jgi:hypothetical protein
MPQLIKIISFICVLFYLSPLAKAQNLTAREVTDKMLSTIDKLKGVQYNTRVQERIDGKLESGENLTKVSFRPFKTYVKVTSAELLYIEGKNSNKALIKANSLPYFNISLDPYSSLLRKNQHHTIMEVGFHYFASIIKAAVKFADKDFDKIFSLKGNIKWEDRDHYVLIIDTPDFGFVPYTVQQGENLTTIADKLKVSDYMIKENNPGIKDYTSVKAGQQILVPTAYAKKTIIYVDKQNFLPVVQIIMDDKGIFARYEFINVVINPTYKENEFDKNFPDYNFW